MPVAPSQRRAGLTTTSSSHQQPAVPALQARASSKRGKTENDNDAGGRAGSGGLAGP